MADNDYYDHDSPTYGSIDDMIKSFVPGSRGGSENIAYSGSPSLTVAMFKNSKGHRANMMSSSAKYIGVGLAVNDQAELIYVQQFIR
jgi:uncharacterized protein YkwD